MCTSTSYDVLFRDFAGVVFLTPLLFGSTLDSPFYNGHQYKTLLCLETSWLARVSSKKTISELKQCTFFFSFRASIRQGPTYKEIFQRADNGAKNNVWHCFLHHSTCWPPTFDKAKTWKKGYTHVGGGSWHKGHQAKNCLNAHDGVKMVLSSLDDTLELHQGFRG